MERWLYYIISRSFDTLHSNSRSCSSFYVVDPFDPECIGKQCSHTVFVTMDLLFVCMFGMLIY